MRCKLCDGPCLIWHDLTIDKEYWMCEHCDELYEIRSLNEEDNSVKQ